MDDDFTYEKRQELQQPSPGTKLLRQNDIINAYFPGLLP